MFPARLFALFLLVSPVGPAFAHEFWISPEQYQVPPGATIRADFVNGEKFEGVTLSYFDRSTARYEVAFGGERYPVEGRAGDRPALNVGAPPGEGLLVVIHETTQSRISYKTWEKFAKFAAHKDFPGAEADHAAAGWPREDFSESYSRHAKALIAVGAGAGADRNFGMATEFVALTNPYDPAFDSQMQVALFYDGAPRADAQVEVFDRAPTGEVTVTLYRSDANGKASIPVSPGHEYLFDAVVLRPAPDAGTEPNAPVWETLWAALTFAVPE